MVMTQAPVWTTIAPELPDVLDGWLEARWTSNQK
jgi:hypothetical protein